MFTSCFTSCSKKRESCKFRTLCTAGGRLLDTYSSTLRCLWDSTQSKPYSAPAPQCKLAQLPDLVLSTYVWLLSPGQRFAVVYGFPVQMTNQTLQLLKSVVTSKNAIYVDRPISLRMNAHCTCSFPCPIPKLDSPQTMHDTHT